MKSDGYYYVGFLDVPIDVASPNIRFSKTPKVVYGQGDATRLLSEERRRLWKAAGRRQDICHRHRLTEAQSSGVAVGPHTVCGKHFVNG